MNLLLLEPEEASGGEVVLHGARARHVREVLRLDVGDGLRVGVVDGPTGTAEVLQVGPDAVRLALRLGTARPPRPRVDLVLALPRPKVLKRLYAPLAALGVGRLHLTNAAKVERYYFDSHALAPAVIRERLLEGMAQARDPRLPKVEVHRSLRALVEDHLDPVYPEAKRLLADPVYARRASRAAAAVGPGRRVLLALGPEGGWTAFERDLFERHGFVGVGLGPRTLRSDTAAVALLAIVHEALEP